MMQIDSEKKYTVAIVGGGGKIGKVVLSTLWDNPDQFPNIDKVVALNRARNVTLGMYLDYAAAHPEKLSSHLGRTVFTSNPFDLSGADLVFITAGLWPSMEEREAWDKIDNTGRLVQSAINFPLIQKVCGDIRHYAPRARVFMVTNQVDMMTDLARHELPSLQVLGIGGYIDTMRFKLILADLLFRKGLLSTCEPTRITAHIIGFHNNDMLLLEDSLKIDDQTPELHHPDWEGILDEAITKTRAYGKRVSDLQRHPNHPHIDSGSSFAPAKAITDVIQAVCTGVPLTASFNVMIDANTAIKYGVRPHQGLSIPVCLRGLDELIEPDLSFIVSAKEQAALYQAQENISKSVQTLFATATEQIPPIDSLNTSAAEPGVKGLSILHL